MALIEDDFDDDESLNLLTAHEPFNIFKNDHTSRNPCTNSFSEYRDCSMIKIDDELSKKLLTKGSMQFTNFEELRIEYEYDMFIERSEHPVLMSKRDVVSVYEGLETLPGVMRALSTMKDQEESYFWIASDLMFAELGLEPLIPTNADILMRIRVLLVLDCDQRKKKIDKTKFSSLCKTIKKRNKLAQGAFNRGDFVGATTVYSNIVRDLDNVRSLKCEKDDERLKVLMIKMNMKAAICHSKLGNYEKVCIHIQKLERFTSIWNNPKALFLQGQAQIAFNNFSGAKKCLMRADKLRPNNKHIKQALVELETRQILHSNQTFLDELCNDRFVTEVAVESCQFDEEKMNVMRQEEELKAKLQKTIDKFTSNNSLSYEAFDDDLNPLKVEIMHNLCSANGLDFITIGGEDEGMSLHYMRKRKHSEF